MDDTNTADVDESAVEGMFNGVPGTFACPTGTCTVRTDKDGEIASLVGTWTFTPSAVDTGDDPHMVAGVVADTDYLDFGYWLNTVENEDGETTYVANTFFRGQDEYGSVQAVEGSATYEGGAAGLFTQQEFSSDGMGTLIGAGRFTANANLVASFGGGGVPADDHFTVKGAITNFMHDGDPIDATWRVSLDGTISQNTGTFANPGNSVSGRFYGDDTAVDNVEPLPTGVAGEFNATFSNGHVIGVFGATKQP